MQLCQNELYLRPICSCKKIKWGSKNFKCTHLWTFCTKKRYRILDWRFKKKKWQKNIWNSSEYITIYFWKCTRYRRKQTYNPYKDWSRSRSNRK
jgi:hypothetical protein